MRIQLDRADKSEVILKIEIESAEYQPFMLKAAAKLSRQVNLEGFRPGKAPYDIVKQRLGEGEIMKEALNEIIAHTFMDAIIKEKLDTVGSPEISVKTMTPGQPLLYEAKIALIPELKLADLDKIKIKRPEIKINDDEINKVLTHLAKSRARTILENRVAENQDMVKLDYVVSLAGVEQEGGRQNDIEVYLGEQQMIPGFEQKILGLKAGDEKNFELTFPKNYFQKNLAGKTGEFKVKIKGVYKVETPELTDGFARGLGDFKNLSDLKEKIKDNIKLEKELKQNRELENKMFDEVIKQSEFGPIPAKLIDNEVVMMMSEIKHDLEDKGLQFELWLKNMKKQEEDLKKDFRSQAERRVKSALIIRYLARQEKITVDDKDIKAEIKKIADAYPDDKNIQERINSKEYYDYMANNLTSQKAVGWLKARIIATR